ncbi:MAG: Dolichyl-phosphate-mannose-protein mannosyltransferase [Candidatus Sumerlaeota bacterium]|nr:Dolichyl-phosphate-mannose-protein mannosyltransferase [Candidatus Sumerlaeota bacterium]
METPAPGNSLVAFACRHPMTAAWCIAFAFLAAAQGTWHAIPPYHDALTNWDAAAALGGHPWFPFLLERDTGHPPLVAWVLGVLGSLLPGRLLLLHLLSWGAGALFAASVAGVARRVAGSAGAVAAGALTLLHPVVFGQALQFNLDLYLAAFSWLGVWAAIEGRPRTLAVALTLAAFAKLNGGASLLPFVACAVWAWKQKGETAWRAWWPLWLPVVLLLAYHVAKFLAVGHLFDSGEFEGGRQLALVVSPLEYARRLKHGAALTLQYNGNLVALALLLAMGAAIGITPILRHSFAVWLAEPVQPHAAASMPWQPRTRRGALLLALGMAGTHLLLHAIRERLPLVRYFMVCYPAITLLLLAAGLHLVPRRPRAGMLAVCCLLVPLLLLKVHPILSAWMPGWTRERVQNPPTGVKTNYENSLEFVDVFALLPEVGSGLSGQHVQAPWPLYRYLYEKEFGIVESELSPPPEGGENGAILVFSGTPRDRPDAGPESLVPPQGYERGAVWQRNRVWIAALEPASEDAAR